MRHLSSRLTLKDAHIDHKGSEPVKKLNVDERKYLCEHFTN